MTPFALSRVHFPVTTLGPGSRIGIWFQGCAIRCPGCVSMDTWAAGQGITTIEAVLDEMASVFSEAEGLTVSGGEPFDQPDALLALLTGWRARNTGDVLVYSGYAIEDLRPQLRRFAGLVDALISDPLRLDVPQTLPLRGSDNQRLHCLTPLGDARFCAFQLPLKDDPRALDIMFDDSTGSAFFAGIPRRGDMRRLAALLQAAGHQAAVTEDTLPPS